ncbi:MAG TPA: hypothetical protein PK745_17555 [bacterium]|mgnify:CR=1 FL=1|nr:hypothetical protein [bacterium]
MNEKKVKVVVLIDHEGFGACVSSVPNVDLVVFDSRTPFVLEEEESREFKRKLASAQEGCDFEFSPKYIRIEA